MRSILVILTSIILVLALGVQTWLRINESFFNISPFIYWIILVWWILLIWKNKTDSQLSLYLGAAIVTVFAAVHGLTSLYGFEPLLRVGMAFWFVGVVQLSIESMKND